MSFRDTSKAERAACRWRHTLALVACCSWLAPLLWIQAVEAQEQARPTARFHYERDAESGACPDEDELGNTVAARLGYLPFAQDAAMDIAVEVRRQGRAFIATLRVRNADGAPQRTRKLSSLSSDCSGLSDAIALAVSIAIDPLSLTRGAAASPSPPVVDAQPPLPAALPPPESKPRESKPRESKLQESKPTTQDPRGRQDPPQDLTPPAEREGDVSGRIGADFLTSQGAVPGVALGVAVHGAVRRRGWSLAVGLRADLPRTESLGALEARVSRLLGETLGCAHHAWAFGCGLASAGVLLARGDGINMPRRDAAFLALAGLRLGAERWLSRGVGMRGFVEATATLTEVALDVDAQEVWRTPTLALCAGLGLLGEVF